MKKLLMALLLTGSTIAQGAEVKGSGKSVDVMKFDVRGIKLGMGQEEALKIIKEKFPNTKIEEKQSEEFLTTLHGKEFVQKIIIKGDRDSQFLVAFAPNVLEHKPKELIVGGVGMQLPNGQDDLSKLQQSAVEKYGAPTVVNGSGDYYWCQLNDKKECDEMKPQLLIKEDINRIVFGIRDFRLEKAITPDTKKN